MNFNLRICVDLSLLYFGKAKEHRKRKKSWATRKTIIQNEWKSKSSSFLVVHTQYKSNLKYKEDKFIERGIILFISKMIQTILIQIIRIIRRYEISDDFNMDSSFLLLRWHVEIYGDGTKGLRWGLVGVNLFDLNEGTSSSNKCWL